MKAEEAWLDVTTSAGTRVQAFTQGGVPKTYLFLIRKASGGSFLASRVFVDGEVILDAAEPDPVRPLQEIYALVDRPGAVFTVDFRDAAGAWLSEAI